MWGFRRSVSRVFSPLIRTLSSHEIATALRPFFFAVHPDFFGQHPHAREVNEESMKRLTAYLDSLQTRIQTPPQPIHLTFFLKNRAAAGLDPKIVRVQVQLKGVDAKTELSHLLKTCNLSTTYVDGLSSSISGISTFENVERTRSHDNTGFGWEWEGESFFRRRPKKADIAISMWLQENGDKAKLYLTEVKPVTEEIRKIKNFLKNNYGLDDVVWSAEWNRTQCIGSFRSLSKIISETPESKTYFRGKRVVFSSRTGVNIYGHILLSPKDVPQNWANNLQNYNTFNRLITSHIPRMEESLSNLLNNIRVVHRKNQQEMLADDYYRQLQKIVNILQDYYLKGYDRPRDCYDDLQFVVEGDSAPLTVASSGQFLAPAVTPASILLQFIEKNQNEAARLLLDHEYLRREMLLQVDRCQRLFSLESLSKDDAVGLDQMIECCRRLISDFHKIYVHLPVGSKVVVTSYYSVLQSGEICIPWNWKNN